MTSPLSLAESSDWLAQRTRRRGWSISGARRPHPVTNYRRATASDKTGRTDARLTYKAHQFRRANPAAHATASRDYHSAIRRPVVQTWNRQPHLSAVPKSSHRLIIYMQSVRNALGKYIGLCNSLSYTLPSLKGRLNATLVLFPIIVFQ